MAVRGGAVMSHLRISDETIPGDLVPKGGADMILSMEPLEALRYTGYLKPDGICGKCGDECGLTARLQGQFCFLFWFLRLSAMTSTIF